VVGSVARDRVTRPPSGWPGRCPWLLPVLLALPRLARLDRPPWWFRPGLRVSLGRPLGRLRRTLHLVRVARVARRPTPRPIGPRPIWWRPPFGRRRHLLACPSAILILCYRLTRPYSSHPSHLRQRILPKDLLSSLALFECVRSQILWCLHQPRSESCLEISLLLRRQACSPKVESRPDPFHYRRVFCSSRLSSRTTQRRRLARFAPMLPSSVTDLLCWRSE